MTKGFLVCATRQRLGIVIKTRRRLRRECVCVFMCPLDARACVTERVSEGEMKSSRQRITKPGHVSGVAAAGPLSSYIYAVREQRQQSRVD